MASRSRAVSVVLLAVFLMGCGSSSSTTPTTTTHRAATEPKGGAAATSSGGWTGMGAPISAFEQAHPKDLSGCSAGTCFGNLLSNSEGDKYEFTLVTTTGPPDYRVDGYTQAFADATPISEAKAAVLQLMPPNTRTTNYFVRHDSTGSTCVFMNVQSSTLGRWFSGKKVGDAQGVMGVELSTQNPNSGVIYYKSGNIEGAVVGLAPLDHGTNC